MKSNLLVGFNIVVSIALIVAVAFLFQKSAPAPSVVVPEEAAAGAAPSAEGETEPSGGESGAIRELRKRVEALEHAAELMKGEGAQEKAAASEDGAEKVGATPVEPGNDGDRGPVTRGEVKKLVQDQLRETWRQWRESAAERTAAARNRKKKTIREVARELEFTPEQERVVVDTYMEMEKETMKILFDIKEDDGLETLKTQLKEAEFDPELKAKLREKIAVNWTLSEKKVTVLWVKADALMRKYISAKKMEKFYRADPEIGDSEYPDIEKMFFGEEESGEGEGEEGK